MLTTAIQVMKYVRASAGRAGLSVVFEDVNQPRHDGKTIYLPKITYKTTERDLKHLMASTDHEVAHDRYSSFEVLTKAGVAGNTLTFFVWNFLEDSRVNNIEAREYKGFQENWDDSSSILIESIFKKVDAATSTKKGSTELVRKVATNLICWETRVSASAFPLSEMAASKYKADKEIQDVLDRFSSRLVDCHFILNKKLGTEATYELSKDILKALSKKLKKDFTEALAETDKDDKKSPTSVSKSDDADTSTEDLTSEEATDYAILTIKVDPKELEMLSVTSPEEGKPMGKIGINADITALPKGTWDVTDFDKFIVVNYPKNIAPSHYLSTDNPHFIKGYAEYCGETFAVEENFAQKVRRLIQIRAKVQTQYGVKKGKLDQSRLSRVCFKTPSADRIFKKQIENTTLDAAITVLVDMSGSMSGEKAFYALGATLLMNEVCSTLNIPLEILGFTDTTKDMAGVPVMFIYKGFSDLRVDSQHLKEYFAKSSCFMDGNPDGENILWAHDRLLQRKEKKRLLIVMSDGTPMATKSGSGLSDFTLQTVREIENSKQVDIYGLGLCHKAVEYYYRAHSVVNDASEIPNQLLHLIEQRILK